MDEELLSIGELARRARVPTSTVRYYERRRLVTPDARHNGQRRYRTATLRRLVFIGMLQDTGLRLDEIEGIINAESLEEWKAIGRRRLALLDQQIERLERARTYLDGALECSYDHPLTECDTMGAEIDRRLRRTAERPSPHPDTDAPASR